MTQATVVTQGRPAKGRVKPRTLRQTEEVYSMSAVVRGPENLEDFYERIIREKYAEKLRLQQLTTRRSGFSRVFSMRRDRVAHYPRHQSQSALLNAGYKATKEEPPLHVSGLREVNIQRGQSVVARVRGTSQDPRFDGREANRTNRDSDPSHHGANEDGATSSPFNDGALQENWSHLKPALLERVTEKNWDLYLSSVRFLSSNEERLVLLVPNAWFQEYLGEHYTEVIEEELTKAHGKHYRVEFVVGPETPEPTKEEQPVIVAPVEPPKPEPQTLEEFDAQALEEDLALVVKRREAAAVVYTWFSVVAQKDELAKRKLQEDLEDKKRLAEREKRRNALLARLSGALLLIQPGDPQRHRQYEAPSAWAPEDGATRAKVQEASRSLKTTPKKKDDSS